MKPSFCSCDYWFWNFSIHGFFKEVFGFKSTELELIRDRSTELHNLVIQKRDPNLKRISHACPVNFFEDVISKPGFYISVHGFFQKTVTVTAVETGFKS